MKLERIVLYDHARPDASREVLLGDKLTCRLNQNLDDFERATPDRDRHSTRSQLAPSEIDLPLAHLIHQSSALCAHSQPLFRISHVSSKFGGAQAAGADSVAGPRPLHCALRSPIAFRARLLNFSEIFRSASRNCYAPGYNIVLARIFLHPNPENLPNQVESVSTDGVANDSCEPLGLSIEACQLSTAARGRRRRYCGHQSLVAYRDGHSGLANWST